MDNKKLRRLADGFDGRYGREYFFGPILSAAIAGRDRASMRLIMAAALEDNISPRMINEIILQSHLFLGYPAMIEASRLFADVHPARHKRNHLPGPYRAETCRRWNREGTAKIKKIYGYVFDRLVPYINSFSPQILDWMINNGYGQVLSRRGASFKLRELSIVATLTVTSYANQLKAHIRGALHTGVPPELMRETISNCHFFCPPEHLRTARYILTGAIAE